MSKNSYKSLKVTQEVFEALTWWKELFEDTSYSITLRRLMSLSSKGGMREVVEKKKQAREDFKSRQLEEGRD